MTSTKKEKVFRLCREWQMGYILSTDLHVICARCLGAEHARQAMEPMFSCPACKIFSAKEKQHRFELFSSVEDEFNRGGTVYWRNF